MNVRPFADDRHAASEPTRSGDFMARILESLSATIIAGCVLTVVVAVVLLSV